MDADFAAWADLLPDPIAVLDTAGRLHAANAAFGELAGRSPALLAGTPLAAIASPGPDAAAEPPAWLRTAARSRQQIPVALRFDAEGGTPRRLHGHAALLRPPRGAEPALVLLRLQRSDPMAGRFVALNERVEALSREVGRRRAAEAELQAHQARLLDGDRRKDEFLAMLAHELRNPLAPLRNGVHLLAQGSLPPPQAQRVTSMLERQLGHVARLVDDLLDVARLTRGGIELRRQPVDLAVLVHQAVEMAAPHVEGGRLELLLEGPSPGPWLDADPARLVQVLFNLLHNACKFTPPGGRVSLAWGAEDGHAVLRVTDTGVGIEPSLLPRVFDLFVQADRSLDRRLGGLGVGLALVRELVGQHQGQVQAESAGPGHGSAFTLRLPLAAEGAARVPPAAAPAPDTPSLRVLVVDDNVDAAASLAGVLRQWGHDARWVPRAEEALALGASFRPQVGLLDIGLPGMTGHELAGHLRRQAAGGALRLIAVTGYGQPADRAASRAAGFDGHLTKPVALDQLRRWLSGDEAQTPG